MTRLRIRPRVQMAEQASVVSVQSVVEAPFSCASAGD
jgi:hypothetical protein